MRFFIGLFFCLLALSSCRKEDNGDEYFYNLTQELSPVYKDIKQIKIIQEREFQKYKDTKDEKYLISSKYVEYYLNEHNNFDQIPVVIELIKLNDDRYNFISMISNFSLALELEHTSPKLAMKFIDTSIRFDGKITGKHVSGHLYHVKGRFYYNKKDYATALVYFKKALDYFKPEEKLYVASMHHNFGLVYNKQNKIYLAINETLIAISLLEKKNKLNKEELEFLYSMKGHLGWYYYKIKKNNEAEKLLQQKFNYYKGGGNARLSIRAAEDLFNFFTESGQLSKQRVIVDYLLEIESLLKNNSDKIKLNEIVQNYYLRTNQDGHFKFNYEKVEKLHKLFEEENVSNMQNVSDKMNDLLIQNINNKYEYKAHFQRTKILWLTILGALIFIILVIILIGILHRMKNEKKLREKQKELFESTEKILMQDMNFHKEKIKNLHHSLALKIDTEKMLLECLKEAKKTNNVQSEKLIRDLLFKVNNILVIDKRNYNSFTESNKENQLFHEKLTLMFPLLNSKELKFCTYFRMELSSQEIATLEDTTTGTVRVYKSRIKSKMSLEKNQDITQFLSQI